MFERVKEVYPGSVTGMLGTRSTGCVLTSLTALFSLVFLASASLESDPSLGLENSKQGYLL